MRILVLSDIREGGEWIATQRLITQLMNYPRSPEFFLIAASKKSKTPESQAFTEVTILSEVIATPPFSFLKRLLRTRRTIRTAVSNTMETYTFDCIFCTDFLMAVSLFFFPRCKDIPVIYAFHGRKSEIFLSLKRLTYRDLILKILERLALLRATHIITPSLQGKKCIQHMLGILAGKKPITIIPNPLPSLYKTAPSANQRTSLKKKLKLTGFSKTILYSGRIADHKGLPQLVEGFSRWATISQESVLILAYPTSTVNRPILGSINQKITACHMEKNVRLIPDLDAPTLHVLYAAVDVVILPSAFEIQPLSVLESLACGTPVIGTAVGNMQEVIAGLNHRFLLPDNNPQTIFNALRYFFSLSASTRGLLKKQSCAVAAEYSTDRSAVAFMHLLDESTNDKKRHD